MIDVPGLGVMNLIEAQEASDVSAINGILSLANILRKRGLLSDAEASAMNESMSLPLGLPKYAENPDVQDLQSNLDRLFAVVMQPKQTGHANCHLGGRPTIGRPLSAIPCGRGAPSAKPANMRRDAIQASLPPRLNLSDKPVRLLSRIEFLTSLGDKKRHYPSVRSSFATS
jgi:hypothetical protein